MPTPLRDVPQPAVELIKCFEGIPDGDPSTVNIDAYLCPAGVWTIGWGHAIVDGGAQLKGQANAPRARALYPGGITREQAETLLRADLIPRAASTSSKVKPPINEAQFGALIALIFNIGAANFGASTLLRKINAGDMNGAADQFLAWDKARVNGVLQALAGLTRRRRAERAMFLGEDWRAVAAMPVRRSRGRMTTMPEVLPMPEMPLEDQAYLAKGAMPEKPVNKIAKKVTVKKPVSGKPTPQKATAKKTPVKKATKKKAPAKKAKTGTKKVVRKRSRSEGK